MDTDAFGWLGVPPASEQNVFIEGLACALGAAGNRVTMYVLGAGSRPLPAGNREANVRVVALGRDRSADAGSVQPADATEEYASLLSTAWSSEPPDAIHAFGRPSARAALAAAGSGGPPVVLTLHPLISRVRTTGGERAEQLSLIRAAARIVATSSSQVFALLGLGASPGAIKFVPCGVDLAVFTPRTLRAAAGAQPLRIVTLGSLEFGAGVDDVIEALSFVNGVELQVGGGAHSRPQIAKDPCAGRLAARAQAYGVADRVVFAGHIERADVADFLRSADIVVCTPHEDSLGTLALAAMACGVPPIVSAVGGLIDAVDDGMTGVHVPPCAPRQIAYALESLRDDLRRRERFGRLGVERATARYGWSRIANEAVAVYRSVAGSAAQLAPTRT